MQPPLFIYVGDELLLALISLPLIAEKIKPNPYSVFRIPLPLENLERWYATNKYLAKCQLVISVIEVAVAIGLYFWLNLTVDT